MSEGRNTAYRDVRNRLKRCDFARDGAEQEKLRAALAHLTIVRRLVVELRFCGIQRVRQGGVVIELPGPRMGATQTADLLGCTIRTVYTIQQRGIADLVGLIAAEDRKERLTRMRATHASP